MTTARLAVFGNPIGHSRSPEIHHQFAAQHGLDIEYKPLLVPVDGFDRYARTFLTDGGLGFNVTVPFKQDAFRFVQSASPAATMAQAVNTVSVNEQGMVTGDNTDGAGLVTDLVNNLGWELEGRRILILGAGGAVRGVLASLLSGDPASISLLNRTTSRAQVVASHFGDQRLGVVEAHLDGAPFDIVINGTSAGLNGELPDLPSHVIGAGTRCYDMSYGSTRTPFLAWAMRSGAVSLADGLGMLVEQAAKSFEIWFGLSVATAPVIERLRVNL